MNELKVKRLLLNLGIPPSINGFDYLTQAVLSVTENGKKRCGELYQEVAKKFNSNYSRVERAIRHATTICFDKMHPLTEKIFCELIDVDSGKVPNYRFICTLAMWLSSEEGDQND